MTSKTELNLNNLAPGILRDAIKKIAVKDVDYFKVDETCSPPSITYSKYCKGGSYISVCRWRTKGSKIILTEVICGADRTTKGWELGPTLEFDIIDPNTTNKISAHMRSIFDLNCTEREPWRLK